MVESLENEITVNVLFFGAARDAVGQSEIELALPPASTLEFAFTRLVERFPDLN